MADNKTPSQEALASDDGITIPRIALGEQGFIGLKTLSGKIFAEANTAFNYPYFIKTVNEIRHNPTVGSAMNVYRMMLSRVNWRIVDHKDATDLDKERAAILRTMPDDMEGTWRGFIEEVIPYLEYGFGLHEKVLRRRLLRNGSKYNDGVVGIKKLAPRNQDTIEKWIFSEDGSELTGVEQNIQNIENNYRFVSRKNVNGLVPIPREKFLLFTASANRGNPQGNSIYKAIYLAYKTLCLVQDNELVGVAKDIQGILKIAIPPEYLAADASADKVAVKNAFQGIIDNYNAGTQRGLLVPNIFDDQGNPLFTYDLLEAKGTGKYDVEAIIKRLQGDILAALNVDILQLGNTGTGSFSLADAKTSILALAIDYRLREMAEVLNSDLIPTIYRANGWSLERLPKFEYEDIEEISLEAFGKFCQQVISVGGLEMDRPVMNRIREVFGVEPKADDDEVDEDALGPNMTAKESKAGEGMKTAGEGTSTKPGGKNASTSNANNK